MANCPGANDNGSGCAAALEIARVFKDISFPRSIIFAFFAFEETGLQGSTHYVKSLKPEEYPLAAYSMETTGFESETQIEIPFLWGAIPTRGNFVATIGSPADKKLVSTLAAVNDRLDVSLPFTGVIADKNAGSSMVTSNFLRSDHAPFWAAGIPALMITDTANFRGGNRYHQTTDTIENYVSLPFLEKVCKLMSAHLYIQAMN